MGLVLRHHREHQRRAGGGAPGLDGPQGTFNICLGAGNGVVKDVLALDTVADHKAAGDLGKGRMQVVPPHELDAQGIFTQAVVAVPVIAAQAVAVGGGEFLKLQHNHFLCVALSRKIEPLRNNLFVQSYLDMDE